VRCRLIQEVIWVFNMNRTYFSEAIIVEGEYALTIDAFAQACETEVPMVLMLIEEGLLQPATHNNAFSFNGEVLARARKIFRLQKDFNANLDCVAVIVDLLDEIERLRHR
jgi:chaperone modulatory protein CbpM